MESYRTADLKYHAIKRLKEELEKENIPHTFSPKNDGYTICLPGISIEQHIKAVGSYMDQMEAYIGEERKPWLRVCDAMKLIKERMGIEERRGNDKTVRESD